jgi:antitoxin component of MazEF toxin-antitoxin module
VEGRGPRWEQLTQHGSSLALVIGRPILDLLKIGAEILLETSTGGQRLIVAPTAGSARKAKFDAAQQWAHKRYGKAFQRLAE